MSKHKGIFWNIKGDMLSGLVVFLIALPLCLGIAQASGAPPFSGIVAGVIGGIIIGLLSKSNMSVSGPAAGLIAIVVMALQTIGSFPLFLCAVMIAGALQLVLGFLNAGTIASYFPVNVIEGMLAGIGITIIIKEIPNAVGFVKDKLEAPMTDAEEGFILKPVIDAVTHPEPGAIIIAVVGLGLLILWQAKFMKKIQLVPAGLIAVLVGTLLNEVFKATGSSLALSGTHLVSLPTPKSASDFLNQFSLPDFSGFAKFDVWKTGIVIAIVASIETLLCIEATDKLDPLKRNTSGNAELRAQGIGNLVSGLIGGLPITSVIVRSSANINAGAKTKLSTMVHGVLLLICVASIPFILNLIPKASLAAILIFTGFRLARPSIFIHMWHAGRKQFIPFVATVLAVVLTDLLKGVALGLIISIFYILRQNLKTPYFFNKKEYHEGDVIRLALAQEVSFLNKASIKLTLENLPDNSTLVLDATNTVYIDYDVLEEIKEFRDYRSQEKDIEVKFVGFKPEHGITNTHDEGEEEYATYDEFLEHYLKVK